MDSDATGRRRDGRRRLLRRLTAAAILGTAGCLRALAANRSMNQPAANTAATDRVTLFLCGDVMTGRGIDQILPHPGDPRLYEPYVKDAREYVALAEEANGPVPAPVSFDYIWGDALAELDRARPDLRIINLETAITTSDARWPKGIHYRMHPANVPCLTAAKIDCCALANNHLLDWGRAGLEETLATLDAAGIKHAGAAAHVQAAVAPAVMELPGKGRVLLFSFGSTSSGIDTGWQATAHRSGVNLLPDLSDRTAFAVARQVAAFRQPGDLVVASIHWGPNWGYEIPRDQQAFARALIDHAAVNVVHGHSSHHVKGIEVYREQPILYGCGDFLTDYEGIHGYEEYRADLGLMYFPSLDTATGRLAAMEMVPARVRNLRVNRAGPDTARWLAELLQREGERLGTGASLAEDGRLALRW